MAGYLPDSANADAFADGWYRTGDVGFLEAEGGSRLTDRSKEMIKVKGFQVAPAEIEAVLHGHPSVLDCAVFGVADEQAGEVPVAAVQLDPAHRHRRRAARLVADSWPPTSLAREVVIVEHPRPFGQGVAPHAARRVGAPPRRRAGGLMDVRLSAEQQALRTRRPRWSAGSARTPSATSTARSRPASSTPR